MNEYMNERSGDEDKMSISVYKFISFIVKSTIFLLPLGHLLLYAWYRYELHKVDLNLYTAKIDNYKSDYYAVLWAKEKRYKKSVYEKGIEMKPIYPIYILKSPTMGMNSMA